jgi:hypothetical protein
MSAEAAAIIGSILGFVSSGVIFLAYSISRTRERLARLEERLEIELRARG